MLLKQFKIIFHIYLKMWFLYSIDTIIMPCSDKFVNSSSRTPRSLFSLIIAVQILIAESLDKRSRKRYNTTTPVGRFGEKTTTAVDHKSLK